MGLRPEHLRVVDGDTIGSIGGRVVHRENLGSDIYLHLDLGNQRMVVRADPMQAAQLSIGDTAHAAPLRGKAMVFAPDGARLAFAEAAFSTEAEVA